ncbi:hypothetical protein AB0M44_46190 [Streptosporangium subroseum]|uniref:hypothetical protein n=1 Tax=Streptosporangium subroseum TaxID=106412 RepID=UPI0034449791
MSSAEERRPSYDELAALVVRQAETIAQQAETIVRQQEIIAQLDATVERLSARVAELERRLGPAGSPACWRRPANGWPTA